jgi:hypothetical protein
VLDVWRDLGAATPESDIAINSPAAMIITKTLVIDASVGRGRTGIGQGLPLLASQQIPQRPYSEAGHGFLTRTERLAGARLA